jgi:hypothetical protein
VSRNRDVSMFCKHGNEYSGSIKRWKFLDYLRNYWLLWKDPGSGSFIFFIGRCSFLYSMCAVIIHFQFKDADSYSSTLGTLTVSLPAAVQNRFTNQTHETWSVVAQHAREGLKD